MSIRGSARESGQGFALVIVLWVLAGLTVVATSIAATVHSNAVSVRLLRERLAAERAFLSTSSRIKVIGATAMPLPTSLFSERGQLFLDGRQTHVGESEVVLLQDIRGLLSLNQPQTPSWRAYLMACGATSDEAERLLATLADYIDSDSLRRLQGAERADYADADRRGPRDSPLLSRAELWRVQGWGGLRDRWVAANCDDGVSVATDVTFNTNTAPAAVLRARGYDAAQAAAMIDSRSAGLPAVEGLLDMGQDTSPLLRSGGRVGDRLRVRHQLKSAEWALEYDLQFTLGELGGPWRMHELRVVTPLQSLPTLSADFPSSDFVASPQDRARLNAVSTSPIGP